MATSLRSELSLFVNEPKIIIIINELKMHSSFCSHYYFDSTFSVLTSSLFLVRAAGPARPQGSSETFFFTAWFGASHLWGWRRHHGAGREGWRRGATAGDCFYSYRQKSCALWQQASSLGKWNLCHMILVMASWVLACLLKIMRVYWSYKHFFCDSTTLSFLQAATGKSAWGTASHRLPRWCKTDGEWDQFVLEKYET